MFLNTSLQFESFVNKLTKKATKALAGIEAQLKLVPAYRDRIAQNEKAG